MTKPVPDAPVIEIIERGARTDGKHGTETVIVPDDVRINGQSILCSDEPVIVHEIDLSSLDAVRVTLTVLARRVVIGAENDS